MPKKPTKKLTAFDRLKQAADQVALPGKISIPPLPPQLPTDLWQIVVVGNIDVRQHYPIWYQLIEAITEVEAEAGKKSLAALEAALPYIFTDAKMGNGGRWLAALEAITLGRVNPIRPEHEDDAALMAQDWIDWGIANDYIER